MRKEIKNVVFGLAIGVLAISSSVIAHGAEYEEVFNRAGDNTGYYQSCDGGDCFTANRDEMQAVVRSSLIDADTLDTEQEVIFIETWEIEGN